MKTTLKSIGAVLAGFATVFVLSVVTDVTLESLGVFPSPSEAKLFVPWMLALALVYRCAYTVLGGYVAARMAPQNPMKHAIILGLIGAVIALIGTIVAWDLSPHWYPIALVITAIPCTWLGGKLYIKNRVSPPVV